MSDTKLCNCRRCLTERGAIRTGTLTGFDVTTVATGIQFVGMIVCEHCGNKRCPHATDHRNACTASNEPGQAGSIFAGVGLGAVATMDFTPPSLNMTELHEAMEKLLRDANIQHAEFQTKQLAQAFVQALQCGDFTRLIVQGTTRESVVYIPYQREQELKCERDAWKKAALDTRVCRADVDVSTPEKYTTAQVNAATGLLNKHNAITEMVARFLIAHRDTHRSWLESFVECGAIKVDFNYHPNYPYVEPVKL